MAEKNPFRFSTKFTDNESGLVYYGYRYYSATTGKWLNRDPLEESGGLNLFAFVANSSPNHVDPFGLTWFDDSDSTLLVFAGSIYDPQNALGNARLAANYAKGTARGAYGAAKGTLHALANPFETIEAIAVLRHLTADQLRCILGSKYHEFMNASPERQAEMIGQVIGGIEAGIVTDAAFVRAFAKLRNLTRANKGLLAVEGRLRGEIVDAATIKRINKILAKHKASIKTDADSIINDLRPKAAALFQPLPIGSRILLRKGATKYDLYHELKHWGDYNRVGPDEFNSWSELKAEESVFNYMQKQSWLTPAEVRAADFYMMGIRLRHVLNPKR
jgi:RHS repeat-associated protein